MTALRADARRQLDEAKAFWLEQVRLRAWFVANMRRMNVPGDKWELDNVIRPREAEARRLYHRALSAVCTAGRAA